MYSKNDVVKKAEYDKLVNKVYGIDTTNFVSRIKYEKDASDFENKITKTDKKIPDVSDLVKKTDSKITEVESKTPNISGLAPSFTLTAVENKIPDISGLATKSTLTTVETKLPDVTSLVTKTDFHTKLKAVSDRITKNKSKHLLVENELKKLKTFDLSYFRGKNYFEESGTIIYLIFQPIDKYFKRIVGVGNGEYISFWKSRGLSNEKSNSITASNHVITLSLDYLGPKIKVKYNGSCLKQDKITYTYRKIVNIYIVYEISKNYNISSYPTLENKK